MMAGIDRLCIYVIYDKDGVIDDYIPYFLNALSLFVSDFVIVCNGKLNDEGREKLSKFSSNLYVRPNEGYDAEAVKDALTNLYGWTGTMSFDELLICNDTFYAPIYPLNECFGKMDNLDVDFWGMMECKTYGDFGVVYPAHLQSYFLNIKFKMLHSEDFKLFWEGIGEILNFGEAVLNYEIRFSSEFRDKGYSYAAYIESENLHGDPSLQNAAEIIELYRAPFIKRKALMFHDEDLRLGLSYEKRKEKLFKLAKEQGYDTEMIAKNLDRIENKSIFTDKRITMDELIEFCEKQKKIYIYGAGLYAETVASALDNYSVEYVGFIVSDNQKKREIYHNHKCLFLSEMELDENVGIVVSLDARNRAQVEPLLSDRGFENYIMI